MRLVWRLTLSFQMKELSYQLRSSQFACYTSFPMPGCAVPYETDDLSQVTLGTLFWLKT